MGIRELLGDLPGGTTIKIGEGIQALQEKKTERIENFANRDTPVADALLGTNRPAFGKEIANTRLDFRKEQGLGQPTPEATISPMEEEYNKCMATYNNHAYCQSLSGFGQKDTTTTTETPEVIDPLEEDPEIVNAKKTACTEGGGVWNDTLGKCVPKTYVPGGPGDETTAPSPLDNPEYYEMILDSDFQTEMKYWNTQKDVINDTYDQGWMDIQAELASGGNLSGTESAEVKAIFTKDRELALRHAYNEIMYESLDRHLEKLKTALDFYTTNKSLDLNYAIQRGQLSFDYFNSVLSAEVQTNQQKIDIFRAITERGLATATNAGTYASIHQNWLMLAAQLGMGNEEAEATFQQLLAQLDISWQPGLY